MLGEQTAIRRRGQLASGGRFCRIHYCSSTNVDTLSPGANFRAETRLPLSLVSATCVFDSLPPRQVCNANPPVIQYRYLLLATAHTKVPTFRNCEDRLTKSQCPPADEGNWERPNGKSIVQKKHSGLTQNEGLFSGP